MSNRAERRRLAKKKDSPTEESQEISHTKVSSFFDKHYKLMIFFPLLLLFLSIGQLGYQYATTGDILIKGISLSGGVSIAIEEELPITFNQLEQELRSALPEQEINVRELTNLGVAVGVIIESSAFETSERSALQSSIEEIVGPIENYNEEVIGPTLGDQFFKQISRALLLAFLFMGFVVFLYFRKFLPGFSVMLSTFADIVITLAIINLLEIRLSTAGIAAFLMLIGYAVDTDLLLSTKLLKDSGPYIQRFMSAFRTGMTMVITTFVAVSVGYFLTDSEVIQQIMLIVLIGLVVDMLTTWIQNAAMMRWYLEYADGKA